MQSFVLSLIYTAAMALVFVGERLIGGGEARLVFSSIGVVVVALLSIVRIVRAQKSTGERERVERALSGLYLLGAFALLLYFAQSDLASSVFGRPLDRSWPRLATALGALWPAIWTVAMLPLLFVELAYASVVRAPRLEYGRIRDALFSGMGLAAALVFVFSAYYVASERDQKIDFSYFRTAKPGEATRKIVRTLDQPLQISLFFPPVNEVKNEVLNYFTDLNKESNLVEVKTYDHAIDPAKAKELGVSGNGIVAFNRGGRRELLSIGTEIDTARNQLKNLDKEAQKRILQVARPTRTVYLTSGHGERAPESNGETDKRLTVRELRGALQQQGYSVQTLSAAQGLGAEVPNDAALVLVLGPQHPFSAEEASALERYFDRGGRLFIALDPENGLDGKELLQHLGLSYQPTALANSRIYAARTRTQSDFVNLVTASFSSHPSVTTLSHLGVRAPMILVGAGALDEVRGHPKELSVDTTVRSDPGTWNDRNRNFQFDAPDETRKVWSLAMAVSKKKPGSTKASDEGRAVVLGDSDALADPIIENLGNPSFLLDGAKWLLGDEAIAGEVTSENDVVIAHTHKQDQVWFYSTIFLAPLLVLGVGYQVTRRRGRGTSRKRHKEAA